MADSKDYLRSLFRQITLNFRHSKIDPISFFQGRAEHDCANRKHRQFQFTPAEASKFFATALAEIRADSLQAPVRYGVGLQLHWTKRHVMVLISVKPDGPDDATIAEFETFLCVAGDKRLALCKQL